MKLEADYTPSERRFEISPDEFSRERIRVLTGAYKEIKQELPDGFGFAMSLFGSLAVGKPLDTPSSADIDLMCYVDSDDLTTRFDELLGHDSKYKECYDKALQRHINWSKTGVVLDSEWSVRSGAIALDSYEMIEYQIGPAATAFRDYCRRAIKSKLKVYDIDDRDQLTKHIWTGNISDDAIMQEAEGLLGLINGDRPKFENDSVEGREWQLALYWSLDIGGGLKPYRQRFLEQLQYMDPAEAERYWGMVNRSVRKFERKGIIPETAEGQYPATLRDALDYYGVLKNQSPSDHEQVFE